jgi:Holliday junction resolvase RusA-like endonuclease
VVRVLTLAVPLKSKERPRFGGNAYMSQAYRQWKKEARRQVLEQWEGPPLTPIALSMVLRGPQRGDLDNLAGAVMDAMTGIAYPDDSVTHIRRLLVTWEKAPLKDQRIQVIVHAQVP